MKTALFIILGAVAGYILVALTLGFVLEGAALALAYLVALILGGVAGARAATQPARS